MKSIIISVFSILLLASCTTTVPISGSISEKDYNGRRKVDNPGYKVHVNPVGIISVAAITAAGAVGGSQLNIIKTYNKESGNSEPFKMGNIAIGAVVGFGIGTYGLYKFGKMGSTFALKSDAELKRWNQKLDRNSILLPYVSIHDIRVIDKVYENRFEIRELADIIDFKAAFPESSISDQKVEQAIKVLKRSELISLLELYPFSIHINAIEERYIQLSHNLNEAIDASKKFPKNKTLAQEVGFNLIENAREAEHFLIHFEKSALNSNRVERKMISLVGSIEDVKLFKKIFPSSVHGDEVVGACYKKIHRDQLPELISMYPKTIYLNDIKRKYINESPTVEYLYKAIQRYPSIITRSELETLAADLILNLKEADDYLTYFGANGYFRNSEKSRLLILENFYNDQKLSEEIVDYNELRSFPEFYKIFSKYQKLKNFPENILREMKENEQILLSNANVEDFSERYRKMVSKYGREGYKKLVVILFETDGDIPAWSLLPLLKKEAERRALIDNKPWMIVQDFGAKRNKGVIYAEYIGNPWIAGGSFQIWKESFMRDINSFGYNISIVTEQNITWNRIQEFFK